MSHSAHAPLWMAHTTLAQLSKGTMVCCLASLVISAAQAQTASPKFNGLEPQSSSPIVSLEASAQWRALTSDQRRILQPLERQWPQMTPLAREKWLNVADRYPNLPPPEQDRIQKRMLSWSGMSALERGQARVRFQQAQQLSAQERRKKWAEYQALPPEKREALIRQGIRQAQPVELPKNMVGPREAAQLYRSPELAPAKKASHQKPKVVPQRPAHTRPTPVVVAPAVVKAGPGATTRLVTQKPVVPQHQQPGAPRIPQVQAQQKAPTPSQGGATRQR